MGRNLFGTNSLEESSHIVVVGEYQGVLLGVVRVNISLTHVLELIRVVTFSVFFNILGLLTKQKY